MYSLDQIGYSSEGDTVCLKCDTPEQPQKKMDTQEDSNVYVTIWRSSQDIHLSNFSIFNYFLYFCISESLSSVKNAANALLVEAPPPRLGFSRKWSPAMDGLCENSDINRAAQMRPSLSNVSDLPTVVGLHCTAAGNYHPWTTIRAACTVCPLLHQKYWMVQKYYKYLTLHCLYHQLTTICATGFARQLGLPTNWVRSDMFVISRLLESRL